MPPSPRKLRRVKVKKSRAALVAFTHRRRARIAELDAARAVALVLAFYAQERIDGMKADDRDMLFHQWGIHSFQGKRVFMFDLTRQMVIHAGEDRVNWQLSLTVHYAPSGALEAIGNSNRLCHGLDELDEFRQLIDESGALAAVRDLAPLRVELSLRPIG